MTKDYIGFTLDLRKLVSVLAQDPTCRAEILAGLQCQPESLQSQLGSANRGSKEAPEWWSVFPAKVEGKNSNEEGLFYRNSSYEGKGDRIQMRLRKQPEKFTQPAQPQYQVPVPQAVVPVAPLAAPKATRAAALATLQANPELFSQLLDTLAAGARAAPVAPVAPVPADLTTVLDSAG